MKTAGMTGAALLGAGLIAFVLATRGDAAPGEPPLDPSWFASERWDDGAAEVSVYEGRWMRYGEWRDAEVRDYVVREYLDPESLVKRDRVTDALVPVVKANRLVSFPTGTYEYRLMSSMFFRRADGLLVKGVGSSQEGCGLAFQRWDRPSGVFAWDTYWAGEARGQRPLGKPAATFFEDELPFVAGRLDDGASITVLPSLTHSNLRAWDGDPVHATVARVGARVVLRRDGEEWARFDHDADGFLRSWRIAGRQEFTRTARRHLYYWQHNAVGDGKLLEASE